jgi:hypothetical protein
MSDWNSAVLPFVAGSELRAPHVDGLRTFVDEASDAWTPWTPSLANVSVGAGSVQARYRRIGQTCDYVAVLTLGSSASVSTNPAFSLPFQAASWYVGTFTGIPIGLAYYYSGSTTRWGMVVNISGTTARLTYANTSNALDQIGTSTPWSWSSGHVMAAWGRYEIA